MKFRTMRRSLLIATIIVLLEVIMVFILFFVPDRVQYSLVLFKFLITIGLFLYLMFNYSKICRTQFDIQRLLLSKIKEPQLTNKNILLKLESSLHQLKDSDVAQDFFKNFKEEFESLKQLEKDIEHEDVYESLRSHLEHEEKIQKIYEGYLNLTIRIIEKLTNRELYLIFIAIEIIIDFFNEYVRSFFADINTLYLDVHNLSSDFNFRHEELNQELQKMQETSKITSDLLLEQNQKMLNFFEFIKNFQQKNITFTESISKDYEKNLELVKNIQDIAERMKMLSLNLSIEANRGGSNKVFDVLAQELQNFTEKIQTFSQKIREEINNNNNKIKQEVQYHLEEIQKENSIINDIENVYSKIQKEFSDFHQLNESTIIKTREALNESKNMLIEIFNHYQSIIVEKGAVNNFSEYLKEVHKEYEINLKQMQEIIFREEDYQILVRKIIENYSKRINTEKELKILLNLCDKYQVPELKQEIQSRFTTKDVIIF
ncbi:MAG: methyl-accepting chemotaxis protein [Leptospiraceae bacterium]|nr:methyl-accepting chemotaxis protein [Leptospiraceae bacterium]MDW7975222.1 methyl-accepting chemotaxis protein [Leptospiraceae bacterium]